MKATSGRNRALAHLALTLLPALLGGCVVSTFEGPGDASRAPSKPLPVGFSVPEGAPPAEDLDATEQEGGERIEVSHILVMHRDASHAPETISRSRSQARERAEEVLKLARSGKRFADLAAEYSDEPGAAERGGRLPPFTKGTMVPAFETAAFALKSGEYSELVETEYGYHVIFRH